MDQQQPRGPADDGVYSPDMAEQMSGVEDQRPTTSQSADFPSTSGAFSPVAETDRYPSPYQQAPQQSRPSSGQAYQDQRQQQQEPVKTQSSVVIKVGMVGDAQIGKTSLMVKYVEGSWDEDYIQTLGTLH